MWNNLEFFRRNFVIKFSKGIFQTSLLLQFLRDQESGFVTILIRTRILPLYTIVVSVPHLIASANWVLGELGSCLPEVVERGIATLEVMGQTWEDSRPEVSNSESNDLQEKWAVDQAAIGRAFAALL